MTPGLLLAIAIIGQPVISDRPVLVLDPGGHTAQVARILFLPEGRELLTVSLDKSIRIWDIATGRTTRTLRPPVGDGYEGSLYAAALAPDGRLLAVGGYNLPGRSWAHIHLIDILDGRIVRTLVGHNHDVTRLAFSPDGRSLISGSRDKTAIVWDVATGAARTVLKAHNGPVWGVAFSPDGRRVATGSQDHTAFLWDANAGRALVRLDGHTDAIYAVAWSPDGRTIATGGGDRRLALYNADGAVVRAYQPMGNGVSSLTFSPDSTRLLVTLGGSEGQACHVLDVAGGGWVSRFDGHTQSLWAGAISPAGDLAATADGDGMVYLWRTADGARRGPTFGSKGKFAWAAGWSHDGLSIAWGSSDTRRTGDDLNALERSFRPSGLDFGGRPGAGFDRARQKIGASSLLIHNSQRSVGVFDKIGDRDTLRVLLTLPPEYPEDLARCASFLDPDRVVVGSDFKLFLFDARTGARLRTFQGHTAPVYALAPSPDGRYFVSASADMTVRVWRPDQDRPILSLFVSGNDWIAWTPEGYYAASLGGEALMGWQINDGPGRLGTYHPAARFRKTLYRPDVIKLVLETGSTAQALARADRLRAEGAGQATQVSAVLPPRVRLEPPRPVDSERYEFRASASATGGHPVTGLRLLVNGRPHPQARLVLREPVAGVANASWTLQLPPGVHRISARATSGVSDAVTEEVAVTVSGSGGAGAGPTATLYVLSIGINAYPDELKPLDAAAPDAKSIHECFRTTSAKLFRRVEPQLLLDADARRAQIHEATEWLASRAKPGDVVVIFYAGHGLAARQFYIAPIDLDPKGLHDPAILASTGISAADLREWLQFPCDTLFLLDACYAGRFEADRTRPLPESADHAVRQFVYDEGMVVMSGANKQQEAGEEESGEHGFFTRALLEGLGGRAPRDDDGRVDVASLWSYVEPRVPILSKGEQSPTLSPVSALRSFSLSKP
jgi:WD40 repeat protein